MANQTEQHVFEYKLRANSAIDTTRKLIQLLDKYDLNLQKTSGYVKKLANAEKKVEASSGGFKKVSQQASAMAARVKQASSTVNSSVSQMSKFMKAAVLTISLQFGKWKYQFDPILKKMQNLKDKAQSVFPNTVKLTSSIGQAFRRVSKSVDENTKSLNKNAIAQKIVSGIQKSFSSLGSLLSNSFQKSSRSVKDLGVQFGRTSILAQNLASAFKLVIGYKLADFFARGVKEALHYTEVLNMFNTIMDKSVDVAQDFVDTIQEMYGLDPTSIMEMTSEFYNLASAVNTPTKAAEKMSMGLMNASLNLASLFDVDIKKVSENLTSGMQGMTRAVRKYGLDLRIATLESTALAYGLKIDADSTSEANRQALRYLTIMRQSRVATGDFAKTIESPANQLRIMKEQFAQLARAIGSLFLPALQKILPYLNGVVMAIRTIIQFIGQLIGVKDISFGGMTDSAKEMDNSISAAGDSVDKLKKKVKQLTAPFDELNILQENNDSSSGGSDGGLGSETLDPTLAKAIEDLNIKLEETKMKANQVRDSILGFLGFSWDKEGKLTFDASQLETNLINKFPSWTETITAFFDNWDGIAAGVKAVWDALGTSLKSVFEGISNGFTNMIQAMNLDQIVADWITELPDRLQSIADWLNDNQDLFVKFGEVISYVGVAFATWKIISTVLSPLVRLVTLLSSVSPVLLLVVAGVVLLVTAFASAWKSSDRFREAVGDLGSVAKELLDSVLELIGSLWDIIGPILKQIGGAVKDLWDNTISVILINVITIIAEVLTTIVKLVTFIVQSVGPAIRAGLSVVVDIFDNTLKTIGGVIDGLLEALKGVIQFITGVFEGDWKKAWDGIKHIFKGILNAMLSVFQGLVNALIDLVNGMLAAIVGGLNSFINLILSSVEGIADLIGIEINLPRAQSVPKIPHLNIPKLAEGGVVTSPTLSVIGEGKYPEAVVPLGNSPQMQELIDQIADALDNKPDDSTPISVTMYLDGQVLYKSVQKASRDRGVNFKMGAFER